MSNIRSERLERVAAPGIFEGVPPEKLAEALDRSERRRFVRGDVVIAEGEVLDKLFVITAGSADVTVLDRDGIEQRVGRVGPGTTVGEMSLVTGEQATATVRATTEVEAVTMSGREFERLSARFPHVYRNVGSVLAHRLARTNRLLARARVGQVVAVEQAGGPPELPWALACSLSWHTRAPTVLVVEDIDPQEPLRAFAVGRALPSEHRASLQLAPSFDRAPPDSSVIEELRNAFDHVLIVSRGRNLGALPVARRLVVMGKGDARQIAGSGGVDYIVRASSTASAGALGPDSAGAISVPSLAAVDGECLHEGALSAGSEAGRALGWLARDLAGLKVGFAFGAGSLRGYAHAGVLAALSHVGLRADYLAGTSVGAAVATLHAMGNTPAEIADELDRCGQVLFRPALSRTGLFSNRALRRYLQSVVGNRLIEDLPTSVAIVAADLDRQQEVILRRGKIWVAILASISIPGVFPAVRIDGRTLVDGGIINPVPTSTVSTMGAGGVVAVRLATPALTPTLDVVAGNPVSAGASALNVIIRSLEIMQARIASDSPDTPLVTIMPEFADLPGAKLRHFAGGRRYMEDGAAAVEAALPQLAAVFPWLRA